MRIHFPFKLRELFFVTLIPLAYAVIAFATIGHYGVSFDEPPHFRRGQAYLHFFLTGKKDYSDIPSTYRRSIYQNDNEDGRFYIDAAKNQSHPPLNDTLAALGNYVFFQKLGILDDTDAHHVFGIVSVVLLLSTVYLFARVNFGVLAGLVASLSVAVYPMFLGESHFNVKDPPETSFFTATLILFWYAVVKKSSKALIASSIFFSLALGTKFNILFLPFIVVPWLFIYRKQLLRQSTGWYKTLLLYSVVVIVVFFATNPNLWNDTIFRLSEMARFYLSVGTNSGGSPDYQPQFLRFGFNTYPFWAIVYSTPLVILLFGCVGGLYALKNLKKDINGAYILVLLWLSVSVLRVTLPGTTIYGGIRHIFEFLPALAIFAGVGAHQIILHLGKKYRRIASLFLLLFFVPIILKLISMHPNENVYFNPLIGGLKGAVEKHFPSAGASLGNTYMQGVEWVNRHSEKSACVASIIGLRSNIPVTKLRGDLVNTNTCRSGTERGGEYAMDMVYEGYYNYWYDYQYYATYLRPVYEIVVDGVTIFQVFKNDTAHTRPELIREIYIVPQDILYKGNVINITLPTSVVLSRLDLQYGLPEGCSPASDGSLFISSDGLNWERDPESLRTSHGKYNFEPQQKLFERRFAAKNVQFIRLVTNLGEGCTPKITVLDMRYHPDVPLPSP